MIPRRAGVSSPKLLWAATSALLREPLAVRALRRYAFLTGLISPVDMS